jgi:hypothetical protein
MWRRAGDLWSSERKQREVSRERKQREVVSSSIMNIIMFKRYGNISQINIDEKQLSLTYRLNIPHKTDWHKERIHRIRGRRTSSIPARLRVRIQSYQFLHKTVLNDGYIVVCFKSLSIPFEPRLNRSLLDWTRLSQIEQVSLRLNTSLSDWTRLPPIYVAVCSMTLASISIASISISTFPWFSTDRLGCHGSIHHQHHFLPWMLFCK